MGQELTQANETLLEFERLIQTGGCNAWEGTLRTGVDLGTANIVLAVVDEQNRPVAGASYPSTVVRDGIVVDYMGAVRAVTHLKGQLEERLGVMLDAGACAIPPGILEGNVKAIGNVVEAAGFRLTNIVDEPTAASSVLGISDGAVVDVGGGTTGISVLKDGKVIFTGDEPTGGTHMTLVLAGFHGWNTQEADTGAGWLPRLEYPGGRIGQAGSGAGGQCVSCDQAGCGENGVHCPELPPGVPGGDGLCGGRRVLLHPI